ncbi:MAG: alpha/beta hydrolase family protein [Azospirillaceae bacterium]
MATRDRRRRRIGKSAAAAAWLALLVIAAAPSAAAGTILERRTTPSDEAVPALAYSVYLPPGYDAESARRFPVLYLLHGYGASDREWLEAADLPAVLDGLIAAGEIAPVIAVMPDAGKSWYVDSAANDGEAAAYETAIVEDLVAEVDARFRTRADPAARAVTGVSMGGFGALRLAFKRPDEFGAVVAFSPGLFKPGGLSWRHGPAGERRATRERWYADTFGDPFDIDVYTGQSPFAYVDHVAAAVPSPEIMLIVGDDDFFGSHDGTLEMYLELRRHGLKPALRVGDGGHDWTFWRAMLPEALRFIDRRRRTGDIVHADAARSAPPPAERPTGPRPQASSGG